MSVAPESFNIAIRLMRRADLTQIAEIEKESYPFPWNPGIFRDCMQTGYLCRVLDAADGLAGYAVVSAAAGEAHILNLCIRHGQRRRRLGTFFLGHLIEEIQRLQVTRVILEVRPSNIAAQALYRQAGFQPLGRRRGYYPAENGREDALVLERKFSQRQPDPDSGSV